MSFLQPSPRQVEELTGERERFRLSEEQIARNQAFETLRTIHDEARQRLNARADHLARRMAIHPVFVGNRMGADLELLSGWATLPGHECERTIPQVSISRYVPEGTDKTRHITVCLRLKDSSQDIHSRGETILTFDQHHGAVLLHDVRTRREKPVEPNTPEYDEVMDFITQLEAAQFQDPS